MSMTPDAKNQLSKTIRALRATLLEDLRGEAERLYRLSIRIDEAELSQALRVKRQRMDAWLDEQVRTEAIRGKQQRTKEDFRRDVEKQAAYTLLNRLVFLRLLEACGERSPQVVTGGWNSLGYKNFREIAPALVRNDETEGYAFLLRLVFEDLSIDLPGLYGSAGMADFIPVPPKTLRAMVDAFDDPQLASCWTDDMTLGWVYQYWNDPEREGLDAKINGGGKIEPHEIASKTQMFTERYMVDWLLQNSLGPMWLAMCKKQGWTAAVEADGTLDRLEARRVEWRAQRDAGLVSLTELMPLHTDAERQWAYYVPQPIPTDAVDQVASSLRDLKILDPAVGSGHFLVVAFDLLFALYQEEAQHRGEGGTERWSDRAIVEQILGHNLHGIDLDPRAVQIAAAALWLKGKLRSPQAHPEQLNLVASNLRLASLPDDDPALVELRRSVEAETGIPGGLTDEIVHALRGADHLGSLLKIDDLVDEAITRHETQIRLLGNTQQRSLFADDGPQQQRLALPKEGIKASVLERMEEFLSQHTSGDDLGLRLRGEQLTAGVRFLRLVREATYDLVVANPPYQGTAKMAASKYIEQNYPLGKADLFAAFLLRGLELVRVGGVSSMLTLRNWMFLKQYSTLREHLLKSYNLLAIGDFDRGAFEEIPDEVVSVAVASFSRSAVGCSGTALCPTPREDKSRDNLRTRRKSAATLCQVGRHQFDPAALKVVPEWPLVYWWDEAILDAYQSAPLIGAVAPARKGLSTGDNTRFLRKPWEVRLWSGYWLPLIKGAEGREWFEPHSESVRWHHCGLEVKSSPRSVIRNPQFYLTRGVAFSMIGAKFAGRVHRTRSVFEGMGSSVFPKDLSSAVCGMNSNRARRILGSLNPGVHFEVGDVNRLPLFAIANADAIFAQIDTVFTVHELHREPSVEFKRPGPSPWRHAQEWAQFAVDREEGVPLPVYEPHADPEPPTDHLSFALGVALGRFGAYGEGILDSAKTDLTGALPAGILFLDGTLAANDLGDGLGHPAAKILLDAWEQHGGAIAPRSHLREYLREKFFTEVHRQMYENRPIHWPISSEKKTFVAWINIHRWNDSTLRVLLADHLAARLTRLEGELNDLRAARDGADKKGAKEAEKRFGDVLKARDELADFIKQVEQCAEKGPLPTDAACPARAADVRYAPDLDDGVMINSAPLWPLLNPQWKDPRKWWKELATAKGKKDYDWSQLAMKYWPARVDAKCQQDPSLGVAHGCFWTYHAARAWAWELRLQEEIGPDFRIEEGPYANPPQQTTAGIEDHITLRDRFLREHPDQAIAAMEKEVLRRRRKQKTPQTELRMLEAGLWSRVPDQVWQLELSLSEKQGIEFRLMAPDEPISRATYEQAHPLLVQSRKDLLARMAPMADLFSDEDEDDSAATDEDDETANDDEVPE
jgi:hypothetical protein